MTQHQFFTDEEIRQALTDASMGFMGGFHVNGDDGMEPHKWEMNHVNMMSAFIDALPDSPHPDWKQCGFEDIEATDRSVRFEFKDGSILQGNPERVNRTDLYLWVGYMLRHVTLTEVKKGKARIYRNPAKVVEDD